MIEVKEFATIPNPLEVAVVPVSIKYPSVVWVFATKAVSIDLVDPGL